MTCRRTFGPLSAEQDTTLLDYFHETKFVKSLMESKPGEGPFLILSRPGAGKTALKKWLLADERSFISLPLDAEKARVFIDDPLFTEDDYRTLLRAELLSGILDELINNMPDLPAKKNCTPHQLSLSKAYTDANKCINKGWWKTATSFLSERLAGLQILGCGFNLREDKRRQYLDSIRRNNVAAKALSALRSILSIEKDKYCLVVDNPEYIVGLGKDLTDRSNALRIGAFINILAEIHTVGLRVMVFTKYQIHQSIQENYCDYSHFSDGVSMLEWTKHDLLSFVKLRVKERLKSDWKKIFNISQTDFVNNVFPCLVNGPRDLLYLLKKAQKAAAGSKLTEEHLLLASNQLREDKYKEMSRLFGGIYPKVDVFCKASVSIIRTLPPPLTMESVDDAINMSISDPVGPLNGIRAKYDWVIDVQAKIPRASVLLGTMGAFIVETGGKKEYPWEGHSFEIINSSESIILSPLFE